MMLSSRSSTMRFVSVAKFPLIRASWSNSDLDLIKGEVRQNYYKLDLFSPNAVQATGSQAGEGDYE